MPSSYGTHKQPPTSTNLKWFNGNAAQPDTSIVIINHKLTTLDLVCQRHNHHHAPASTDLDLLLLRFKAGAPRTEHYQLVRALSADAVVVTVLTIKSAIVGCRVVCAI